MSKKTLKISDQCYNWQNIMKNTTWQELNNLIIMSCRVTEQKIRIIIDNVNLEKLQTLHLDFNQIGPKGIRELVSQQWKALKNLRIAQNLIGNEGSQCLFSSDGLEFVEILDINSNNISSLGLKTIPETGMNKITHLNLSQNDLGPRGVKLLIKGELPHLSNLDLRKCKIADEGAKHLAKGYWSRLADLNIADNEIQEKGMTGMVVHQDWRNLGFIYVFQTKPELLRAPIFGRFNNKGARFHMQCSNAFLNENLKKILDSKFKTD